MVKQELAIGIGALSCQIKVDYFSCYQTVVINFEDLGETRSRDSRAADKYSQLLALGDRVS